MVSGQGQDKAEAHVTEVNIICLVAVALPPPPFGENYYYYYTAPSSAIRKAGETVNIKVVGHNLCEITYFQKWPWACVDSFSTLRRSIEP